MKEQVDTAQSRNIDTENLTALFLKVFEQLEGKGFIKRAESWDNLKALAMYFSSDEGFYRSEALRRFSKPSLSKGLLIVGGCGSGKSSMMRSFERIFQLRPDRSSERFIGYTASELVERYEGCQTVWDKAEFWKRSCRGIRHFDDVKTEPMASNYGTSNLMRRILERRYEMRVLTHISCNYAEEDPGNISSALEEFGRLYGSRVYDRLFEMFNILEFKGKSFRR